MIQVVKVGKLRTNREPSPLDDFTELEASLLNGGLQVPLLVNENMFVVDGVRRLAAIKKLGFKDVICQVTNDFDEAMENLAEGRKSALQVASTPSRLYGQYTLISVMGDMRVTRLKAEIPWVGKKAEGNMRRAAVIGSYRHEYIKLMGVKENLLQEALTMYRYLETMGKDNPSRKTFAEAMERWNRGETSQARVHNLYVQLRQTDGGRRNSGVQQNQILTGALSAMEGMWRGLQDTLPLSPDVDREKVSNYIRESRAFASRMRTLANEMERQLNE